MIRRLVNVGVVGCINRVQRGVWGMGHVVKSRPGVLLQGRAYSTKETRETKEDPGMVQTTALGGQKMKPKLEAFQKKFSNQYKELKLSGERFIPEIETLIKQTGGEASKHQNPFSLLFIQDATRANLVYWPTKIRNLFKSYKPLSKSRLNEEMRENFINLFSAIENNDIDFLSKKKYDSSHLVLESCRDLFYTYRKLGINYKFRYDNIQPLIYSFVPNAPYFDALVFYYIDATVALPNGSETREKYLATVLWRGSFPEKKEHPEYAEMESSADKKKIDYHALIDWKVGELFTTPDLQEITERRVLRDLDLEKFIKNKPQAQK